LAEVDSLRNKKKLGGENLSESNSHLESPGSKGETIYKNFTEKHGCGKNGKFMTYLDEKIKSFPQ